MSDPIIFNNVYDSKPMSHWHGKEVEIHGMYVNPNDTEQTKHVDAVSMPMLKLRLKETGELNDGFIEEIPEKSWPKPIVAFIKGIEHFDQGCENNPYCAEQERDEHIHFGYGFQCASLK